MAHARALLGNDERWTSSRPTSGFPDFILQNPTTHRLIDLTRPVAVLFVSVLHFIPRRRQRHRGTVPRRDESRQHARNLPRDRRPPPADRSKRCNGCTSALPPPSTARPGRGSGAVRRLRHGSCQLHRIKADDAAQRSVPVAQWRPDSDDEIERGREQTSPFLADFLSGVGTKRATTARGPDSGNS
nr:SAM-dependent methyltransferase [Salinispora arenicola]